MRKSNCGDDVVKKLALAEKNKRGECENEDIKALDSSQQQKVPDFWMDGPDFENGHCEKNYW